MSTERFRINVEESDAAIIGVPDGEVWLALEPQTPFVPDTHTYDLCIACGTGEAQVSQLAALIRAATGAINAIQAEQRGPG